ncbi:type II secretion system protein N [uncultured Sphingomonas sp.]|uniref:type II secretion system protein N n=1 Tax=uncultured Sphingomonas sp. TaxID=158754 RepID=UPI0035CBDFFF
MRLKMNARTRRLLARLPTANVYSILELALLAALAVQVARLLWVVVTPVGPVGDWRPAQPSVAGSARDILTGFDPFFRLSGAGQPASATALNLTLFGTRIDEASGRGSAIIAGADKLQKSIAVGEEITAGVKLRTVAFDHVTIDRGGASEDLYIDQSGVAPPMVPTPGPATPPPITPPISQLRQDIGFSPRIDNGRISGLVVRSQGSGVLFRQAGLRDGDVVTAIGGRPVTGPQDVDRVARDFAGGGAIPLTVERGSTTLPLSITIAPTK